MRRAALTSVFQILHLGLGNQFYSSSSIRDEIFAAQLRLHPDGQIRTVRTNQTLGAAYR